jgi:hypothetical protein
MVRDPLLQPAPPIHPTTNSSEMLQNSTSSLDRNRGDMDWQSYHDPCPYLALKNTPLSRWCSSETSPLPVKKELSIILHDRNLPRTLSIRHSYDFINFIMAQLSSAVVHRTTQSSPNSFLISFLHLHLECVMMFAFET